MSPHDIRDFLRQRPFRAFRIHTSEGQSYDVHHPDEALVLATRVIVPDKSTGDGDFFQSDQHLALAHILRIEELHTEAPHTAN